MSRRFIGAAVLTLSLVFSAHARAAEQRFTFDPQHSLLTVNVFRTGALSSMLHDHHFVPEKLSGAVTFDPANSSQFQLQLSVDAASLKDKQHELSDKDLQKVNNQIVSPEVLDAARYPTIEFKSSQVALSKNTDSELAGTTTGTLTLHGVSRDVPVSFHATRAGQGWKVEGHSEFNQTEFGIKPVHKALGAISVKDRVSVDFRMAAVGAESAAPR